MTSDGVTTGMSAPGPPDDDRNAARRQALAERAIALIDLTDLADDHGADGIEALCGKAVTHGTAAVCVWPEYVARGRELLAGTQVRVATVVNFPSGLDAPDEVAALTSRALADGADDIDVVLPYTQFAAGDVEPAAAVLDAVRAEVTAPAIVKVILETGELTEPGQVMRAAQLAVDHGADFIKTSTGKSGTGATPQAVRAMLEVIAAAAASGRQIGLKPSGGIRTLEDAATYLELADRVLGANWASPATFRFGASGLLDVLVAELEADVGGGSSMGPNPGAY
ncbi:MAG: deoxyribose-phosphate aldolase [Actinomycetota bacterium]